MLNEFILPVLPVVENSDVNSYAMGLVATQRPKTKCFYLGRFCEWLCLLLLVGDQRPPFVRTAFLCSKGFLLWPYSHCWKCVLFYMSSKRFNNAKSCFESCATCELGGSKLYSRFTVSKSNLRATKMFYIFQCIQAFGMKCFWTVTVIVSLVHSCDERHITSVRGKFFLVMSCDMLSAGIILICLG